MSTASGHPGICKWHDINAATSYHYFYSIIFSPSEEKTHIKNNLEKLGHFLGEKTREHRALRIF